MKKLFETVDRAARAMIPVLIRGETGSGKEVVAQELHKRSPRHEGPIVCVNCGAIASQLLESTLFGHEKGAFTGAVTRKAGVFEAANGGTVFLDEIGELPAAAQAALLRVLETGKVTRVGATTEIDVDARIVAATHRDLDGQVTEGNFREDLLFRLNALTLHLPPLQERKEEIPILADRFLARACAASGVQLDGFDQAAIDALVRYRWKGNIRELKNVVDRAVVVCAGSAVGLQDLPDRITEEQGDRTRAVIGTLDTLADDDAIQAQDVDFKASMKQYERRLLLSALQQSDGVQTVAAQTLKMPLRTFVHKLKTLGIRRKESGYDVDDGN